MRTRFEKQLSELEDTIISLGELASQSVVSALEVLLTGDETRAVASNKAEQDSDVLYMEVQTLSTRVLLQQQPVSRDLRIINGALRIACDLERIADMGADIARVAMSIGGISMEQGRNVAHMADASVQLLDNALMAIKNHDPLLARSVISGDKLIDTLFGDSRKEIVDIMMKGGATEEVATTALDIMLIAKYIERIGDHTVNVAEAVLYEIGEDSH